MLKEKDRLISDKNELAEIMNDFFANIGPEIVKSIPNSKTSYTSYLHDAARDSVFLAPIEYNEIESIIRKLNNRKATGPNSFPVNLIKDNPSFFPLFYPL